MASIIWSCPNCDSDLKDDLYAQFGLWCPECEEVISWASIPQDYDGDDYRLRGSDADRRG